MSSFITHRPCCRRSSEQGILLVTTLVYGAIFFTLSSVLFGYIYTQSKVVTQRVAVEQAGAVAEAGLNYYKWFLAHYPDDVTNGTGEAGPYVHEYFDPEGAAIGEFSLEIDSTSYCGDVTSIAVRSTGHVYDNPTVSRTIAARYTRPTVAEYAFILNSSVWSGPDRVITGPYHSNGGIRMDSTHNSSVTSGQTSWTCTSSFGCEPTSSSVDGVYTTSGNATPALFDFPSSPVNFAGLTVDLSVMKDRAQNQGGLYIPRAPSNNYGYSVEFNSNDTVTVRRVTKTQAYWGYSAEEGWQVERNHITNTRLVGTYPIPADCPVIFVEDKVWLSGTVSQKVALAAADLITPGHEPSIIVQDNITYTSATSSGLLAIAENNVLLGLSVPNDLYVNGIFVAQNGRYSRNHYCTGCYEGIGYFSYFRGLPYNLDQYVFRDSETLNGTIVSNGRVGTQWTSGETTISGFRNRYNSYDRSLAADPPPLTPKTSDVYEYTDWQDVR